MRIAAALLTFVFFTTPSCASEEIKRVLFIGNSLSYSNDLPKMVISLTAGRKIAFQVESVAKPNYSLEDHWNDGEALHAIRQGGWDVVILQQGPSALPESRENLLTWARKFNEVIRQAGAVPAFLAVWPSKDRIGDFDRVLESYRLAAKETAGIFIPAGAAWRAALHESVPVYGPDGFHPSRQGSYLAALVIVGALCEPCRVSNFPADINISAAEAAPLRRAAESALKRTRTSIPEHR